MEATHIIKPPGALKAYTIDLLEEHTSCLFIVKTDGNYCGPTSYSEDWAIYLHNEMFSKARGAYDYE